MLGSTSCTSWAVGLVGIFLSGSLVVESARAQEAAPVRASSLRNVLVETLIIEAEQLHLNMPPSPAVRVAAVFTISDGGIPEVVDELDAALFEVEAPQPLDVRLNEETWLDARESLPALVELAAPLDEDIRVRARIDQVAKQAIWPRDAGQLRTALRGSTAIREAAGQGRRLFLANCVVSGRVTFSFPADELPPNFEVALPGFSKLASSDESWTKIVSQEPVIFAYTANECRITLADEPDAQYTIEFAPFAIDSIVASVWERRPITLRTAVGEMRETTIDVPLVPYRSEVFHAQQYGSASQNIMSHSYSMAPIRSQAPHAVRWDEEPPRLADLPMSAAPADAQGSESDPQLSGVAEQHEGRQVTVLYGTCRERLLAAPTWSEHASNFVRTGNGLITIGALSAIGLFILLVLGFLHRLTWLTALMAVGLCMVGYLGAMTLHARQQVLAAQRPDGQYGILAGELRYGLARVSVPEKHVVGSGKLESPYSFFLIQMPEDPNEHFVVTDLKEDREAFIAELKRRVERSDDKDAFVFIHGYNVKFGDAVKRTAQLAVDLQFPGAPICFTWPSEGDLRGYIGDGETVRVVWPELRKFLTTLKDNSGAKRIHLLAHSMGNELLSRSLVDMRAELAEPDCVFKEILLAAPDVNSRVFEAQILPAIRNNVQHITLYASANDRALLASYEATGRRYPRAGMAGDFLLLLDGVDTIDVSGLDTDFLGHAVYGDHQLAVTDIGELFRTGARPPRHGLVPKVRKVLRGDEELERTYWTFE